jgi:hypothetical protein
MCSSRSNVSASAYAAQWCVAVFGFCADQSRNKGSDRRAAMADMMGRVFLGFVVGGWCLIVSVLLVFRASVVADALDLVAHISLGLW